MIYINFKNMKDEKNNRRETDMVSNVTYGFYVIFVILTFFIWCDLCFFSELASERSYVLGGNKIEVSTTISIKLRTQDQFTHYIGLPVAQWFERTFRISKIPFVTPNLITAIHFTIGIICGRLAASTSLSYRRFGVLLFLIRCTLDSLDGVVYRAQSLKKEYKSDWNSFGYIIDGTADTLAGIFVLIGILYRFNKYPPVRNPHVLANIKNKQDEESMERLYVSEESCSEENDKYYGIKRHSKTMINFVGIVFGFIIFCRCMLWDYYNEQYYNLLMSRRSDIPVKKQAEVLTYISTWLSLWLWTINSADAFLFYALCSIYFDKLWSWMYFNMFFSMPSLVAVCMYCQIHLIKMRELLGVEK